MSVDREELYEELLDLSKSELIKEILDLMEDREEQKFERVIAVKCFGVFKNYDGSALDSNYFLYTINEQLARQACALLDANDGGCVYVDGWEHAASWDFRRTIVENEKEIKTDRVQVDETVDDLRDE